MIWNHSWQVRFSKEFEAIEGLRKAGTERRRARCRVAVRGAARDSRRILLKKSPNVLRFAMRGVNLTLTATALVTVSWVVLNGHSGDGRCDSDATPANRNGGFEQEVHKAPVSLHAGDKISLRGGTPSVARFIRPTSTTDRGVYNLNFVP